MTRHASTLLIQTADAVEIGKADLDLLKKLNLAIEEIQQGGQGVKADTATRADTAADADKLNGQSGSYYNAAENLTGTISGARLDMGYIRNAIYPIGSYYTQYPDASSNTDSVEFPTTQTPAALFGGTWVEQWSTESIFFRTRGTNSDRNRTNGQQLDAVQNFAIYILGSTGAAGSTVGLAQTLNSGKLNDYNPQAGIGSGAYGSLRSDNETRPINRRIKVWKRTA